jgi:CheY-like chemotaxis protein
MNTVFFVDDDGLLREMLARALEKESLQVRTFGSPNELLASLDSAPPDIVVSDVQMPEMSGLELLEQIRSRSSLPVILISGHVTEDVEKRARELDATHVLSKPIRDFSALARLITEAVAGQRSSSDQVLGLDRLRMDFLTGLSHELRTPLTAIKLALDGLFSNPVGNGGGSRKLVEISQRNVDRLIRLVESQLDLLQIMLCEVSVSRRLAAIEELVRKASLVSSDARPFDEGGGDVSLLFTDPERLQSVLEYVFRHATDTSHVVIDISADGRYVTIDCTNTTIMERVDRRSAPILHAANGDQETATVDQPELDFELRACQSLVESLGGTLRLSQRAGNETVSLSLPRFPAFDRSTDLVLPLQNLRRSTALSRNTTKIVKCKVSRNGHHRNPLPAVETAFLKRCLSSLSDHDVVLRGDIDGEYYLALIGRSSTEVERIVSAVGVVDPQDDEGLIEIDVAPSTLDDLASRDRAFDVEETV